MVSLIVIFSFILSGSFLTRWILKKKKFSTVRVSSALTLLVIFIFGSFEGNIKLELSSAFLGGTFIGMTDYSKLSSRGLFLADLVYTLLFCFILPFNIGLGGALGFAAVISCLLIHNFLVRVFPLVKKKYSV